MSCNTGAKLDYEYKITKSAHAVKISFALPLRDAFFMYIITK